MKVIKLQEPLLQFGTGEFIDPKQGIWEFGPYDLSKIRPEKIRLGFIGRSDSVDKILSWIDKNKAYVEPKKSALSHLFSGFCGFNTEVGFKSEIVYDDGYIRKINNSEYEGIIKKRAGSSVVDEMVELYISEIRYLTKNKRPDVILSILPENLVEFITGKPVEYNEDGEEVVSPEENDFRRQLKAKAMAFNVPIQIVRDRLATPSSEMQDQATIAWNFFTALYYKASGTPWALKKNDSSIVCYAGISFYKSRDRSTTQTSVTQIFNEHGKGVILRGAPVMTKKGDREPHLTEEQSFELMNDSLQEYYEALKIYPQRLVIHKSSNYSPAEIEGFRSAAYANRINSVDLVTIMSSPIRLYSNSNYPPRRGTLCSFDDRVHVLYSRGFVDYYSTYPGMYIPNPIEIRLYSNDESPEVICQEILSLTKMNWNNTQFDKKYPITIECSRKVGEILKYLTEDEIPQIRYSFYM